MAQPTELTASRMAAVVAALAIWCMVLLGPALHSGYRYDDAQHLQFAAAHAPWQYFTQRELMLQLSYAHIAPWNALFFDIGLPWFGLDARGHHAHLLMVLWLTSLATWRLLRRWLDEPAAVLGGALFLAMPATGVVGHLLMNGHYAWGMLFSVLAAQAYCRAVDSGSSRQSTLAAACFAMACLCKELYVPLPLVWWVLPVDSWRQRLQALLPSMAVLLGYALLRAHVLGGVGGYAALTVGSPGLVELAVKALQRAAVSFGPLLFGVGPQGWLAMALTLVLFVAAWRRARRPSQRLCWTAAGVLLAPVLPLFAIELPYGFERVMLLLAWTLAVVLAWLAAAGGRWVAVAGLSLAALLAVGQRSAVRATLAPQQVMAAQNAAVVSATSAATLVPEGFAHVGALRLMADAVRLVERREPAALVDDEDALARLGPESGPRALSWSADCACLRPLGAAYDLRVRDLAARLSAGHGRKLRGRMTLTDHGRHKLLSWAIDADPGTTLLQVRGFNRLVLARSGQLAFGIDNGTRLGSRAQVRLLLEADDGALTRSDWRELALTGSTTVSWP